jgi:hypothetical protein
VTKRADKIAPGDVIDGRVVATVRKHNRNVAPRTYVLPTGKSHKAGFAVPPVMCVSFEDAGPPRYWFPNQAVAVEGVAA